MIRSKSSILKSNIKRRDKIVVKLGRSTGGGRRGGRKDDVPP